MVYKSKSQLQYTNCAKVINCNWNIIIQNLKYKGERNYEDSIVSQTKEKYQIKVIKLNKICKERKYNINNFRMAPWGWQADPSPEENKIKFT